MDGCQCDYTTQVKKDLVQDEKYYPPAPPKLNFVKGVKIKDCGKLAQIYHVMMGSKFM
jgi:hypothetical protein